MPNVRTRAVIAGVLLAGTAGCSVTVPAPEFVSYVIENRTHEPLELSRESPGREDDVATIGPCITAAWEDWDPDPRVALSVNGRRVWQSAEFPRPDASIVHVLVEEDGTVSVRLIGASPDRPADVCGGVPAPSAAPGGG